MADVITGEAVALELPVATFPSRIAALLLDMLVQLALLVIVTLFVVGAGVTNADYAATVLIVTLILALIVYPTGFETLSRGRTLGKMALGIRVVGDDGSPIRFRQALVRALVGVFEIWTPVLAPVGLITSIISARGKRVGDVFAGTYVIQERAPARRPLPAEFAMVPPPLAGWAQLLQVSGLSDQTADAAGSYLRRFAQLAPQARESLGVQFANAVAAQVSPPPPAGTPPAAYLSAVLAVRRERERARLAAMQPATPAPASAPLPAAAPPAAPSPAPAPAPAPAAQTEATPPQAEATLPQAAQTEATPPQAARPEAGLPSFAPPA